MLYCNIISHRLNPYPEWSMHWTCNCICQRSNYRLDGVSVLKKTTSNEITSFKYISLGAILNFIYAHLRTFVTWPIWFLHYNDIMNDFRSDYLNFQSYANEVINPILMNKWDIKVCWYWEFRVCFCLHILIWPWTYVKNYMSLTNYRLRNNQNCNIL